MSRAPPHPSRRYCSCWLSGGAPGWLAGLEGGIAAGCSPAPAAASATGPEAALLAADCERLPSISEPDTSPDCRLLVGDMPACVWPATRAGLVTASGHCCPTRIWERVCKRQRCRTCGLGSPEQCMLHGSVLAGIEGVAVLFCTRHSLHSVMRMSFRLHPPHHRLFVYKIPFLHSHRTAH